MIIRRAKAFKRHCETKTITIQPYELIVGNAGAVARSIHVNPELSNNWFYEELKSAGSEPDTRPVISAVGVRRVPVPACRRGGVAVGVGHDDVVLAGGLARDLEGHARQARVRRVGDLHELQVAADGLFGELAVLRRQLEDRYCRQNGNGRSKRLR